MVDGGVVIGGVTTDVGGASGATVSVIVSPVVISDVETGPGGGGSSWAALTLDVTDNAPMASNALAPTAADSSLICFEFTVTSPFRSLVGPDQPVSWPNRATQSRVRVDPRPAWITRAAEGETAPSPAASGHPHHGHRRPDLLT